jgi:hypothetical protein
LLPLDKDWLPLSENPDQKQAVQIEDALEETAFKPGFEIVKF